MARWFRRLLVAATAVAAALVAAAGPAMAQAPEVPSVPFGVPTSRPPSGPSSECLVAEALRGASTSTTHAFGGAPTQDCRLPGQEASAHVDKLIADGYVPPPTTRSGWEVAFIVLRLASLTMVAVTGVTTGIWRWRHKRAESPGA